MRQAEKALRDAGWEEVPVSEVREGDEVYDLKEHDTYVARIDGKPASIGRVLRAPRPEPEYEPGTVALIQPYESEGAEVAMRTGSGGWWVPSDRYIPSEVEVLRVIAHPDGSTDLTRAINVTRVEVIDDKGRAYINTEAKDVEFSFQDGGRTLKVFTGGTGATPRVTDKRVESAVIAFRKSVDSDPMGKITDPDGLMDLAMRRALKAALEDGNQCEDLVEGMVPRIAKYGYDGMKATKAIQPGPNPPAWSEADEFVRQSWEKTARHALSKAYEEATE